MSLSRDDDRAPLGALSGIDEAMRRLATLSTFLVALAAPAHAQAPRTAAGVAAPTAGATAAPGTAPRGNVSAVGRVMPPTSGRMPSATATDPTVAGTSGAKTAGTRTAGTKTAGTKTADAKAKAVTEAEMLKAQKAAEMRNKAWDARMRKTMGSICSGC